MTTSMNITKAISAHAAWKRRLAEAIDSGKSDITVARLRVDNECEFGKWFYNLPPSLRESEQGKKVRALHAAFHIEAAKILEMALRGSKAEAMKSLEFGTPYTKISQELVLALSNWK